MVISDETGVFWIEDWLSDVGTVEGPTVALGLGDGDGEGDGEGDGVTWSYLSEPV